MKPISKDEFVALLDGAGVTDQQKHRLHALFEARHPEQHRQFLEMLGIPEPEIVRIREASRKAGA